MRVSRILVAAGILGCLLASSGQAAIYKWMDANGHVHFSDHPSGKHAKQVEIRNAVPPEQQREAESVSRTYQNLGRQYDQEKAARKAKAQATARAKAKHAVICRELNKEVNVANQHPLVRFKQDGTPQYLTDDQTAAYRQRLQRLQKEHCSGQ